MAKDFMIACTTDDLKWLISNIQAECMLVAQSTNGNPIQMLDEITNENEWVKEFMDMKKKGGDMDVVLISP